MTEREEALRRFPPAEAQKLVPMTEPVDIELRRELRKLPTGKLHEAYDKLKRGEKTSIEVIERHRAAGSSIVVDGVVIGGIFLILKLLAEVLRERERGPKVVPQIPPLYSTPVRKIKNRLEDLRKSDPEAFYRELKEIRDAIKERERGKIKRFPQLSLTELREIKKDAEVLYR